MSIGFARLLPIFAPRATPQESSVGHHRLGLSRSRRKLQKRNRDRSPAHGAVDYGCLETRQVMAADPVLTWNSVLLDAIRTEKSAPPMAARAMAIVHTAIHDAVNSIEHCYQLYAQNFVAHPQASVPAAIAAAAERTLTAIFPAQHATFALHLQSALSGIPDGIRETQGIAAGQNAADQILALRAGDGAFAVVDFQPGTSPGEWRPTPPGFLPSLLPQWPDVVPFSLHSGSQFRPDAPPALSSTEYAAAVNQVQQWGASNSALRTAEQDNIARIWMAGPGTATPPGQWNQIAGNIAMAKNLTSVESARLMTLLNMTLADAGIAAWDCKYAYNFWRPITAIREAANDGNPATNADAAWTPYITTPPFSAYVSGHSTFSAAGAGLLQHYFGTDQLTFQLQSEFPGVPNRTFSSLTAAANEAGMSRIYGGIHFIFDHTAGSATGRQTADWVWNSAQLAPETSLTAYQDGQKLLVCGTLSDDQIVLKAIGSSLAVFQDGREVSRFARSGITHVVLSGSAGNDRLEIRHSLDVTAEIFGGAGDDRIFGAKRTNWIYGQAGNDFLCGGGADDVIRGGAGNDSLMGLNGRDQLFGDAGWDTLCGGLGDDDLTANRTEDRLIGRAGRDRIFWV